MTCEMMVRNQVIKGTAPGLNIQLRLVPQIGQAVALSNLNRCCSLYDATMVKNRIAEEIIMAGVNLQFRVVLRRE
jgi:hypothetical protein